MFAEQHLSNERKAPGLFVGYSGDEHEILPSYMWGDYFINHHKDIPIKQTV